jgi:photosystem II stability/assembly factor-like uncharacterized protein
VTRRQLLLGLPVCGALPACRAVPPAILQSPRRDAWRIVGPGGGGAFFSPAISPHDSNLVLATSDMTDSFLSENGGRTWREFNLRMMARFLFDPRRPNRIWAVAGAAGAFVSDDRGRSWRLFYPDPSTVGGVSYLDDEGDPIAGSAAPMTALAVDPEDVDTLFAIIGSTLRISSDGGRGWHDLARDLSGSKLFVDPASPRGRRSLYIAGRTSIGVWDGAHFKAAEPPAALADAAFGFPHGGKPVIYAATERGAFASRDGGRSWQSLGLPTQTHAVAVCARHPEVVYVSYSQLPPGQEFGVARSADGGAHWSLVWKEADRPASNIHDAWITRRFGPDWGGWPLGIAVADNDPNLVFTTDLGRILRSTDGGARWDALYSQPSGDGFTTTGLDPTTCYGVHFDPFDARRLFVSYTDIGLFRSEDGGASWQSATARGVPRAWLNTTYWVVFDPAVRGRLWAAMSRIHDLPRIRMFARPGTTANFQGGVVRSDDGGLTWTRASSGLPEMAATHILLDPRSPSSARVLYATGFGRGVFRSDDGGLTWAPRNQGLPPVEPLAWRLAMDAHGVLYVVVVRRSRYRTNPVEQDGALYRSRDGAAHWEAVPLPAGINSPMAITPDPSDPTRLYLSAWAPGGVFLSTDAGAHWRKILDAGRIYDVTVDPHDPNVLYATGFEASAWRSADRGASWQRIRGFNFKHGHRVIPDPADRSKIYIATFGSSVWHGPATGDPAAAEDIAAPPAARFSK